MLKYWNCLTFLSLALLASGVTADYSIKKVNTTSSDSSGSSESSSDTIEAPKDAAWYWHNEVPEYREGSSKFTTFQPNDTSQTCYNDTHATPFNKQVRGVNLGGWLVLEPWITPSLFYQFLSTQARFGDLAPNKTAMDMYTFCTALGPEEANRQLRIHWENWVTEADMKALADAGVNSLRVPVGDWMFMPYEPYIGCTDGSIEQFDRMADLALKYGLDILIDFHGHDGSQNGFDNSGRSMDVKWTSVASTLPVGTTTFEHWPIRVANWMGTFDRDNGNYSSINYNHLNQSLEAVVKAVERYADHPAILGLLPVNEPWELTPIDLLKDYYWKSYKRMKAIAPKWKFILHDSFRFGVQYWSTFMIGCPDIAIDTHIYQAWLDPGTAADMEANACQQKFTINAMENALLPVIVGEWSLATDNCEMWLNGFNDNLPGFPKVPCSYDPCPLNSTYLGEGFPGTPLDPTKPLQGPYGTGTSGPSFGKCPVTSKVAFGQKDDIAFTRQLNLKKLNAFSVGHGWYFWNFKREMGLRWNFLELVRQGVFPKNVSAYTPEDGVHTACDAENQGQFVCRAKRGVSKWLLENGLAFACNDPDMVADCKSLKYRFPTLEDRCDYAYNKYWHMRYEAGATCDFGGSANLIAINLNQPPKVNPATVKSDSPQDTTNKLALGVGVGWTVVLAAFFVGVAAAAAFIVTVFSVRRRRGHYVEIPTQANGNNVQNTSN